MSYTITLPDGTEIEGDDVDGLVEIAKALQGSYFHEATLNLNTDHISTDGLSGGGCGSPGGVFQNPER